MSDLVALSSSFPACKRIRIRGINERVPAVPVSQRHIKTIDELPPHLKRRLDTLPPYLPTKPAAELNGGGRSKLYDDAAEGRVMAIKHGATTLWCVASILLNLANMPPAPISPGPSASRRPGRISAPTPSVPFATAKKKAAAPLEVPPPPERAQLDPANAESANAPA